MVQIEVVDKARGLNDYMCVLGALLCVFRVLRRAKRVVFFPEHEVILQLN